MSILKDEEVVLECPKCKRHGLVRLQHASDDEFECVYCHNREVLNQFATQESDPWLIILALATVLLLIVPLLG